MRDVKEKVMEWVERGETFALTTVVSTSKSAPRSAGATMAVSGGGEAVGSVSGGCVEGAVYQLGQGVLEDGAPVLQRFGYSDDDAFAVGLTCGGIVDVFIERVNKQSFPEIAEVISDIENGKPVATATVVEHPQPEKIGLRLVVWPGRVSGTLGSGQLDHAVAGDAQGLLATGDSTMLMYGPDGDRLGSEAKIFVSSYQPKPRMIVFGAIDFASAVAKAGSMIGFEVTVCDARQVFATAARFPAADEVIVSWPHTYLKHELAKGRVDNRTVICVLTHDPKFDVPLLDVALRLEGAQKPAYIGVMGSRKTHYDRIVRLQDAGVGPAQIAQMRSPIGLDLGGRTPEETAVSVAAEIIAERWGGTGQPLKNQIGSVHSHTA